jgi:chromosome segregation ATPase
MKREFLEKLNIEKEVIDKIMAEAGKDVEALKSQVETLKTSETGLKEQITQRDKDLSELKKSAGDSADLKTQYEELQTKYKAETKALSDKITDTQLSAAIKVAVAGIAHDPDLMVSQIDKSKITIGEDGNVKMGLAEQIKALQKDKAFLFKTETGVPSGGKPGPTGDDPPETGPSETDLNAVFGIATTTAATT